MYIIKHIPTGKYIPNGKPSSHMIMFINRNDLSFLSEKSKKVFQTKKNAYNFLNGINGGLTLNKDKVKDFSIIPLLEQ